MSQLTVPDMRLHRSFVDAMAEFRSEGRGGPDDDTMVGSEIRKYGTTLEDPGMFAGYVEALRAEALPDTPRPEGFVPCTTLWWADGDTYLGRLAIRHSLTPALLEHGGHIGYDVRATARHRGHATAMLRAGLEVARGLGIESALLTCDPDNVASRKVIEACGGAFEDERSGKLRYWIATVTLRGGRGCRGGPAG